MRKISVVCVLALALLAAGCYNNPHTSELAPGKGGRAGDSSRGPTVGPGTVAGGSTAGQQPAKPAEEHAAEPAPKH